MPWFGNGTCLIQVFKNTIVDPGKGGIKRGKKNIVLGIKQDQDPHWFKVTFASDWMRS